MASPRPAGGQSGTATAGLEQPPGAASGPALFGVQGADPGRNAGGLAYEQAADERVPAAARSARRALATSDGMGPVEAPTVAAQPTPASLIAPRAAAANALARFFRWLVDEGELKHSPMAQLPRPTAPLGQPTVLTADQILALLGACAGPAFEDLRDAALIRLFVETGLRLTEMAALDLFSREVGDTRGALSR